MHPELISWKENRLIFIWKHSPSSMQCCCYFFFETSSDQIIFRGARDTVSWLRWAATEQWFKNSDLSNLLLLPTRSFNSCDRFVIQLVVNCAVWGNDAQVMQGEDNCRVEAAHVSAEGRTSLSKLNARTSLTSSRVYFQCRSFMTLCKLWHFFSDDHKGGEVKKNHKHNYCVCEAALKGWTFFFKI